MPGKSSLASDMKSLENFDLVKTVGTGTFSRVYLCQHKQKDKYFAIKILPINDVIQHKQVQHVKNEKEVLQKIHHPFLISLTDCWKDAHNLYFLFPFQSGGELFTFMRMYDRLSPAAVKFYTSEIVCGLSYLHSLNIAYRDLKPENILLDAEGHTVLTDFGFAKTMTGSPSGVSYTMCGTPEYLAPEILQGRGHSKTVDWWSLGILIYEMLTGQPPFVDTSLMGLYEKIMACELEWREQLVSVEDTTKDLVRRLLHTEENLRLGGGCSGAKEIQDHKYFAGTNWSDVYSRALAPPIVPCVSGEADTRYFNFYQENEVNINDTVTKENMLLFADF